MSDKRSAQDQPAPPQRAAGHGSEHAHPALSEDRGDDPAAGSIDSPTPPGEAQAGDLSEQAANLGGPIDVFPLRGRNRREGEPG